MSLDADLIVDRRRMRRKLTFWRVTAVFVAIAALAGGAFMFAGNRGAITGPVGGGSIARVTIEGLITTSRQRTEALKQLTDSKNVKAVIVHINSPGGTVAGSEELYDALTRVKAKKPMVVVVDGLAASGGYIAAIASDRIMARQSSTVGSIGVIFQFPNFTELLKTVGVQVESIKSSPLKASPNGLEPTTPEARAAMESLVKDSYDWFRGLVRERRGLDQAALDKVADGRVYTGRQALELKLIDALGDEVAAVDWLAKEKGVDPETPVRDYRLTPRFRDLPFLGTAAVWMLDAMGLSGLAERFKDWGALQAVERLNLDGLLALWHPSTTN